MGIHAVKVVLPMASAINADAVVNTFHFAAADAPIDIVAAVEAFYQAVPAGGTNKVGQYIGISVDRAAGACSCSVYDLADPEPRTPVLVSHFTMPAVINSNELPSEVSVCLSYHASSGSGLNMRRRRGRLYLGPLSDDARSFGSPRGEARVSTLFADDLSLAGKALMNDGPTHWGVYSRVDAAIHDIVGGYVDNAFDTQRRRGEKPTVRTVFP